VGANPQDAPYVQALIKAKYTKIQALKKKIKIHGIEHVKKP
jgi:hypothetical protein